ncbi:MAG: hypothetical protein ACMG55_09390 [Microcoleus sp.]
MKKTVQNDRQQRGFVAIFTVLFFVIFVMVITLGFLRIIVQEQQQAGDNSLTASALAAARAGVEDGKRAILLFNSPATQADLVLSGAYNLAFSAAGQADCTSIYGSAIGTRLGLDPTGKVAGTTNLNQKYSCLTITPNSPDYQSPAQQDKSTLIPLKGDAAFNQIEFSWHSTSLAPSGEGPLARRAPALKFPTQAAWGAPTKLAAYARLELITVGAAITPGSITSQTAYLIPGLGATTSAFTNVQPNISTISCNLGAGPQYACKATIPVNGAIGSKLYLRVTPLYGPTHFKLLLQNGAAPVNFNGVQSIIDSTGQANDVFRRVQARVSLTGNETLPEFALESGTDVCKSFAVTNTSIDFSNTGGICDKFKY